MDLIFLSIGVFKSVVRARANGTDVYLTNTRKNSKEIEKLLIKIQREDTTLLSAYETTHTYQQK